MGWLAGGAARAGTCRSNRIGNHGRAKLLEKLFPTTGVPGHRQFPAQIIHSHSVLTRIWVCMSLIQRGKGRSPLFAGLTCERRSWEAVGTKAVAVLGSGSTRCPSLRAGAVALRMHLQEKNKSIPVLLERRDLRFCAPFSRRRWPWASLSADGCCHASVGAGGARQCWWYRLEGFHQFDFLFFSGSCCWGGYVCVSARFGIAEDLGFCFLADS